MISVAEAREACDLKGRLFRVFLFFFIKNYPDLQELSLMPSNIPSKSDENSAAEFIKHQKLCDLDYYSRFSREELETKHADILHLYEALKKDTRFWIVLSFVLIPVSALILWDFYLLLTNPTYAFYASKNMNIAEIIALLIHIGALLLHAAFIAFSVSDGFYLGFLRRQKETVEELLTINEAK